MVDVPKFSADERSALQVIAELEVQGFCDSLCEFLVEGAFYFHQAVQVVVRGAELPTDRILHPPEGIGAFSVEVDWSKEPERGVEALQSCLREDVFLSQEAEETRFLPLAGE